MTDISGEASKSQNSVFVANILSKGANELTEAIAETNQETSSLKLPTYFDEQEMDDLVCDLSL